MVLEMYKNSHTSIGFQKFPRGLYPWTPVKKGIEGQGAGREGEWNGKEGERQEGRGDRRGGEGRGGSLVLTPLLFSDNSHTAL
jgi:hypothetical protein